MNIFRVLPIPQRPLVQPLLFMVGKPCLVVVVENPNQLKLNLKCPYWSYEVRLVCRSCLSQHICTVKCAHNENQQTKPEAQTSKLCSRKTHSIKIFLWRGICENNGKQGKGLSRWLSDAVGLSCPVRSTFVLVHIFCFCSYFCSYFFIFFVHSFCSYFLFLLIFLFIFCSYFLFIFFVLLIFLFIFCSYFLFIFLSDPSPIIGNACQWLTHWLTPV